MTELLEGKGGSGHPMLLDLKAPRAHVGDLPGGDAVGRGSASTKVDMHVYVIPFFI